MTTSLEPDTGPEVDPAAPHRQPGAAPRWTGPLTGLAAGAIAVCTGLLLAAVIEVSSPLDAVGSEFIDRTPKWLEIRAIEWFGSSDKDALRIGMIITIAALAAVVGALARRHRWFGPAGLGAFGVLGAVVAAGRPDESAAAPLPALFGAVVGGGLLWYLSGIIAVNDGPREMPGRSRIPAGWDRRRFLATTASATAIAAVATFSARRLEEQRISDFEAGAPDTLPPVTAGTASPSTSSDGSAPAGGVVSPIAEPVPASATVSPHTPFITPNDDFYLIDTALSLPRIDIASWRVSIGGMVSNPLSLSYDDLLARSMVQRTITITCVSNEVGGDLIGTATWQGVLLKDLLDEAGVDPAAEQVFGTSVDGWTCGFPVAAAVDGRDAMIAIGMNGEPLPLRHGFPARVIVPGLYGYVSATKWLDRIDLTTWDQAEGYWVPRGWSRDAPIKTQSRIDFPRRSDAVTAGTVTVAGIAWAQHRGVDKVEVRIDEGEWQLATLADDVSNDAWRQWSFPWDAAAGDHRIQVRATDKTGATQTEEVARPDPDGATGYHTRSVSVRSA